MILVSPKIQLKTEVGYIPTNITLVGMYKNSILVKFWRTFEIEIKLHDSSRIKDLTTISIPSEETSFGNTTNFAGIKPSIINTCFIHALFLGR
jgi:hypothetical protein